MAERLLEHAAPAPHVVAGRGRVRRDVAIPLGLRRVGRDLENRRSGLKRKLHQDTNAGTGWRSAARAAVRRPVQK